MLTVVILDGNEPNVIKLTYENLFKEIKQIPDGELIVAKDWFDTVPTIKNKYVCFVEPDCLISSGYFSSQMGLFKKNPYMRKLAMLSSAVGVDNWANRVYGYKLGETYVDGIIPVIEKTSSAVHPVQIGFVPGSIIRVEMLKKALETIKIPAHVQDNLVRLSTDISLSFWRQGDGNRVHINPNTTYVTTENYVNDILEMEVKLGRLTEMFRQEVI